MHLNLAFKRTLLVGGIGLALVVAGLAIGARTPAVPPTQQPTLARNPEPVASTPEPFSSTTPAGSQTPPVYAVSPFGTPVVAAPPRPAPAAPLFEPVGAAAYVAPASPTRRVVRSRRVYRTHSYRPRTRVVVRRRPFKHSVAIVGGSAAGGAAIGALAGGGKGAIAGGLVGGVGGLVYDRLTHKKREVVTR
jgi:hypothetical protein